MNRLRWVRSCGVAGFVIATALGARGVSAYTAPYSTPSGITLVDVAQTDPSAIPQFLWRRLGDAAGNPLYTYDADLPGKSSCYGECAQEFPPLVADAHAKVSGDFSVVARDDHVTQWVYQGKPLYRYSGRDPIGELAGAGQRHNIDSPARLDPASNIYSPKQGWRRAAYMPEKSIMVPSNVELDALGVANGFGFVDAATHMTIYAAPPSHRLSSDWEPVRASALALPGGEFSIIQRKDDGTRQWVYRGAALYTYAGDYAPGEVTGIFTGDKSIQAALAYRNFTPPGIEVDYYPGHWPLMTTGKGRTLYTAERYFVIHGGQETRDGYWVPYNDAKSQGTQACQEDCTTTWKPVLASKSAEGWGFWEPIARPDGSKQWAFKGCPVYTYVGDKRPGDVEGNNRNVIVYGGPQGQIVYASAGDDPRDSRPLLGKISMVFAAGGSGVNNEAPATASDEDAPDVVSGGGTRTAGTASGKGPVRTRGPTSAGAGFYWHTVPLF